MSKFVESILKEKNKKNTAIIVIISFIHFLISIPFTLFPATHLGENDIKAFYQPPALVFEVVWPILYSLLAAISLYTFYCSKTKIKSKTKLIYHSILEALGQGLWLLSFGRYIDSPSTYGRYEIQYFLSAIIILLLMLMAWLVRLPDIWNSNKKLSILYLPYALWITFATFLNIQILYKFFHL